MQAVFVVVDQPSVSNDLDLFKVSKQMCIEHLSSVGPVKALDEGIWIWLARLDISDGNAFGSSPRSERLLDQLGPIVSAEWLSATQGDRHPEVSLGPEEDAKMLASEQPCNYPQISYGCESFLII